jgi:hypothetical protein
MTRLLSQWPHVCIILLGVFLTFCIPETAHAQELEIDACATQGGGTTQDFHYSRKIVQCVMPALIGAATLMANTLANSLATTVLAMCVLAISWLGVQIAGGEKQFTQKTITLLIKIGVVAIFYLYVGGVIQLVFAILLQFLTLINGGYAPWDHIDAFLGKLIGFLPTLTLDMGLLGILGATFLSSTTGIFMFMSGITALLDLLFFFFNIIFVYLLSITVIAFMLALMPLFTPMLIFYYTEKYFTKWWTIIVSAMLVPILMFTFLWFFFGLFGYVIADIFRILGFDCPSLTSLGSISPGQVPDFASCTQPDYSAYWKLNQPMFSWLMPADPHLSQQIQNVAKADEISTPAVQSNINPLLRRALNNNSMNTPGVHFGPNHEAIMQDLVYAFITLWVASSLMKSIMAKIPGLADDITGALNRITTEPTQIERTIRGATNPEKMNKAAGSISDNVKQTVEKARNMAGNTRSQRTQNGNNPVV